MNCAPYLSMPTRFESVTSPLTETDTENKMHDTLKTASRIDNKELDKVRSVVFLDIETQKTDADVGGWDNAADMLVAVAVTYNSDDERFHVYEEKALPFLFDELSSADLVVGYNIRKFDYTVLSRYAPSGFGFPTTLDIMEDVGRAAGHRVKLDNLAKTTIEESKTASGLDAVRLFREGAMHELTAYCVQDVRITRDLYLYGLKHGAIAYKDKEGNRREIVVEWGQDE